MKYLIIILIVSSALLLSTCDKYLNTENYSTYSRVENRTENTEFKTEIDKILAKIDNSKPYNETITKTVDVENLSYFIGHEYRYLSMEEFNKKYYIECLRKVSNNVLYSVHKTKNDGVIYVFFGGNDKQKSYHIYGWYYVETPLKFSDFKSIKSGISTIEDVEKLDPATTIYKKSINNSDSIYNQCEHYLSNGILTIIYKKDKNNHIVDKIVYSEEFKSGTIAFSDGSEFEAKILDIDFKK